jgi:hypothetical protein
MFKLKTLILNFKTASHVSFYSLHIAVAHLHKIEGVSSKGSIGDSPGSNK